MISDENKGCLYEEGTFALSGIHSTHWIVYPFLLISQVIMGVVNNVVSYLTFRQFRFYFILSAGVSILNLTIFIVITLSGGIEGGWIAARNRQAIIMRSVVWGLITGILI